MKKTDPYEHDRELIAEELLLHPKSVSVNIKPSRHGTKAFISLYLPIEYAFLTFTRGNSRFQPCWLHDYHDDVPEGVRETEQDGFWLVLAQSQDGHQLDHRPTKVRVRCTLDAPPGHSINQPYAGYAIKFACKTHHALLIQIKREAFTEGQPIMNKSTMNAIQQLNGQMAKVYNALPAQDTWTVKQITAELARTGQQIENRALMHCLGMLRDRGLATESPKLNFKRAHTPKPESPAPELAQPTEPTQPESINAMPETPRKGPMELLADLASKARQFADELDSAALEIEQEFQNSEAKSEQLKQLKSLLKGITD